MKLETVLLVWLLLVTPKAVSGVGECDEITLPAWGGGVLCVEPFPGEADPNGFTDDMFGPQVYRRDQLFTYETLPYELVQQETLITTSHSVHFHYNEYKEDLGVLQNMIGDDLEIRFMVPKSDGFAALGNYTTDPNMDVSTIDGVPGDSFWQAESLNYAGMSVLRNSYISSYFPGWFQVVTYKQADDGQLDELEIVFDFSSAMNRGRIKYKRFQPELASTQDLLCPLDVGENVEFRQVSLDQSTGDIEWLPTVDGTQKKVLRLQAPVGKQIEITVRVNLTKGWPWENDVFVFDSCSEWNIEVVHGTDNVDAPIRLGLLGRVLNNKDEDYAAMEGTFQTMGQYASIIYMSDDPTWPEDIERGTVRVEYKLIDEVFYSVAPTRRPTTKEAGTCRDRVSSIDLVEERRNREAAQSTTQFNALTSCLQTCLNRANPLASACTCTGEWNSLQQYQNYCTTVDSRLCKVKLEVISNGVSLVDLTDVLITCVPNGCYDEDELKVFVERYSERYSYIRNVVEALETMHSEATTPVSVKLTICDKSTFLLGPSDGSDGSNTSGQPRLGKNMFGLVLLLICTTLLF